MEAALNRTAKDWLIAVRPWSFTTSSVSILATIAYIFYASRTGIIAGGVDWVNAFLCLPMLVILHSGGNLVSDYYDHVNGVDGPDCPNGVTWIRSGLFKPKEILHYGWILLAAGALLGIYILYRSSFTAIWIGVFALALPLAYPFLKAHLLGDLDILLCFGIFPGIGTCFVATGSYHPEMLLLCLPYGLHIVAILHSNNTRDIVNDRDAGLDTICGEIGGRKSQWVYLAEILIPYILVSLFCIAGGLKWWLAIVFLSLPVAVKNIKTMMNGRPGVGDDIPRLDQATAQFQFLFGILYSLGFFLGGLI